MASREQPGLVETIFNKITGKEPEGPPVRTQEQTDALYAQLDKMTKAYTPDPQTASDKTTPGVDQPKVTTTPLVPGTGKTLDEILEQPPTKPSATEEIQNIADELTKPQVRGDTRLEQDAQRRRDRQEANKNIRGSTARKTGLAKSATRGLSKTEKKGGAGLDSRFGISGLEKGGLASKKSKKKKSK